MRRMFRLVTILITSFVMALSGLAASSVATASENQTVRVSATFPLGASVLTKSQKTAIKKAVATSGTEATFLVTAAAGKLPGVSDSAVQLLAKKRGQEVKAYLVKLGVSKSSVTVKVKVTRVGIVPKTKLVGTYAVSTVTTAPTTTATDATPTTTTSPTTPTTPALSCAAGGTCAVGDAGPGGGIVYYVDVTGFDCGATYAPTGSPAGGLCNYLEVAPSGWDNGGIPATDPAKAWATGTSSSGNAIADVSGVTNDATAYNNALAIGLGLKNSIAIVAQGNDTTTAAGLARAYTGGSKSDWYLPTTAELNLLCQWGRGVTQNVSLACTGGSLNSGTGASGGLAGSYYWSSSEKDSKIVWVHLLESCSMGPCSGPSQFFNYKYDPSSTRVRPVRAF